MAPGIMRNNQNLIFDEDFIVISRSGLDRVCDAGGVAKLYLLFELFFK